MTLALARELAPHVPVALIQPAMIDPPPDFTESDKQAVLEQTPLRRIGILEGRQPADPLPARRNQLRHRLMLPGRRRAVSGAGGVAQSSCAEPGITGKMTCDGWAAS